MTAQSPAPNCWFWVTYSTSRAAPGSLALTLQDELLLTLAPPGTPQGHTGELGSKEVPKWAPRSDSRERSDISAAETWQPLALFLEGFCTTQSHGGTHTATPPFPAT